MPESRSPEAKANRGSSPRYANEPHQSTVAEVSIRKAAFCAPAIPTPGAGRETQWLIQKRTKTSHRGDIRCQAVSLREAEESFKMQTGDSSSETGDFKSRCSPDRLMQRWQSPQRAPSRGSFPLRPLHKGQCWSGGAHWGEDCRMAVQGPAWPHLEQPPDPWYEHSEFPRTV